MKKMGLSKELDARREYLELTRKLEREKNAVILGKACFALGALEVIAGAVNPSLNMAVAFVGGFTVLMGAVLLLWSKESTELLELKLKAFKSKYG